MWLIKIDVYSRWLNYINLFCYEVVLKILYIKLMCYFKKVVEVNLVVVVF